MPLLAGNVTISPVGSASGTGLAKEIYDDLVGKFDIDPSLAPNPQQSLADLANSIASVVIAHFQSNAQVPAGIAVATTGTAAAQTGATTAPGTLL
jgi:hypothetical protein